MANRWLVVPPLLLACMAALGEDAGPNREAVRISIDVQAWKRWGFQYPVTYVFRASRVHLGTEVLRRDGSAGGWERLPKRTSADFFNGIECVRLEEQPGPPDASSASARIYVSVGFHGAPVIELRFDGAGEVRFDSIARYYDGRRAAYTLSDDNWGRQKTARPGAPWHGMADDRSDKYQAAVHACRSFHLPVSVGVVTRLAGAEAMWQRIQEELDRDDYRWEPAAHSRNHPCTAKAYAVHGYADESVGCAHDILARLRRIPYGQQVYEFILPCGYQDDALQQAAAGEFLFLRAWDGKDHPESTAFAPWNSRYRYYGIGGFQTVSYDAVLEARRPKGRYYAADVQRLNAAFDAACRAGGIFYAMWHSDRYENSVLHDMRPGVDGQQGSTLMQHFAHVAHRRDVWYVANGWLYSYRYVAEHAQVAPRGA